MVIGLQMDPIFSKELLLVGPEKCGSADSFIILKGKRERLWELPEPRTRHAACYTACSLFLEFYPALPCGPTFAGSAS